jgi:outer membrane protein assembly factor BamB
MIKHFPITNTDKVIEHYSQKDNVPISYICTTELHNDNVPVDIFYRDTPHPTFGNKYFGLRVRDDSIYISNADKVEDCVFGCVEDDDGDLQYSQFRHDYKRFSNGNMIDGGRSYIKHGGKVEVYVVRDGKMVKND